jgi:hypothetical protein
VREPGENRDDADVVPRGALEETGKMTASDDDDEMIARCLPRIGISDTDCGPGCPLRAILL